MERLQKKLDAGSFKKLTEYIRGALRLMKKLSNRGIKRQCNMQNLSTDEMFALPLVRWASFLRNEEVGYNELLAVKQAAMTSPIEPHIICVGDRYKRGNFYIIFNKHVAPCGTSSLRAIETLFKSFHVFALEVPVLLRKLNDLVAINVFNIMQSSTKASVNLLSAKYREFSINLAEE
ncbi:uncharacterized protein LOC134202454 [Armigeres subalbatus]|uniref:uncharacterized protein LOC134202454 n=1 Tax=Armigeres subalbatus TaxID=124917 RepID=UPI002ED2AB83